MPPASQSIDLSAGNGPLHERLAKAIAEMVASGDYSPGQRLPAHRQLASRASVSIGTVTKAIDVLTARGIVRGEVGRGTFINAGVEHSRPSIVDLTLNVPPLLIEEDLFVAASQRSARRVLRLASAGLYDLRGTLEQRSTLSDWLSRTRLETPPEALVLCVGAQQAICLAFEDLKRASSSIACEAATFSGAIAAASHLGMRWHSVDHDDEGMIPSALDRLLTSSDCRIVYATHVCQNPLGFEVSEGRRRDILKVVKKHDAYIVEDDIYGVYATKGRLTYKELAPSRVYYLTSLSKCLTPLARVGILVPPEDCSQNIMRMLRAEVFGAPPAALELGCALIELGADIVAADALRTEARIRVELAGRLLGLKHLPMPAGAPHLWLEMPAEKAERLARRSSEQGVRLTPPDATSIGGASSGGIRLSILAPPDRADMERAVRTVAQLLNAPEQVIV
jgi:DNA-binding transcriptional MocR family regulator